MRKAIGSYVPPPSPAAHNASSEVARNTGTRESGHANPTSAEGSQVSETPSSANLNPSVMMAVRTLISCNEGIAAGGLQASGATGVASRSTETLEAATEMARKGREVPPEIAIRPPPHASDPMDLQKTALSAESRAVKRRHHSEEAATRLDMFAPTPSKQFAHPSNSAVEALTAVEEETPISSDHPRLNDLPSEILSRIADSLSPKDIVHLAETNRTIRGNLQSENEAAKFAMAVARASSFDEYCMPVANDSPFTLIWRPLHQTSPSWPIPLSMQHHTLDAIIDRKDFRAGYSSTETAKNVHWMLDRIGEIPAERRAHFLEKLAQCIGKTDWFDGLSANSILAADQRILPRLISAIDGLPSSDRSRVMLAYIEKLPGAFQSLLPRISIVPLNERPPVLSAIAKELPGQSKEIQKTLFCTIMSEVCKLPDAARAAALASFADPVSMFHREARSFAFDAMAGEIKQLPSDLRSRPILALVSASRAVNDDFSALRALISEGGDSGSKSRLLAALALRADKLTVDSMKSIESDIRQLSVDDQRVLPLAALVAELIHDPKKRSWSVIRQQLDTSKKRLSDPYKEDFKALLEFADFLHDKRDSLWCGLQYNELQAKRAVCVEICSRLANQSRTQADPSWEKVKVKMAAMV